MSQKALLKRWRSEASRSLNEQRFLAGRLRRRHLWLGIIAVIVSTIVGSSLVAKISDDPNVLLAIGWLSLIGALCSAANTFLNYGKSSEAHEEAARKYEGISRSLEVLILSPEISEAELKEELAAIRTSFDAAGKKAPIRVRGVVGGGGDDDDDDDDDDAEEDDDDESLEVTKHAQQGVQRDDSVAP